MGDQADSRGAEAGRVEVLNYRAHVDGLRAMAVLAVVAYHAGVPHVPGGFVGVDVFFVISGFLITGLLFREFETTGKISLREFYARRIRRLAPALLVVLAATLVLGARFLVPIGGEQQGLAKSTIATLLLSSNIYFALTTGDYFDGPAESQPLLHTWSLSVEEQFYLVWPALILGVAGLARSRGWRSATAVGALIGLVLVSSLALSVATTSTHPQFAFYGSPTRAWEFAVGGLAFFLTRRMSGPLPLSQPLAFAGLAMVGWAVVMFSESSTPFPGWHAAIPVVGTAAVILGCEKSENGACTRLLSWGPAVFVGLISYSLYLWHWPLLVMANLHTLGEIGWEGRTVICLMAGLLAWLTYRYIEHPIRSKRAPLLATTGRAYVGGAVGTLLIVLVAGALGAWAKFGWTRDESNVSLQSALGEMRKVRVVCGQSRPYGGALLESEDCDRPRPGAAPQVLVWGDSHAAAITPAVERWLDGKGRPMRIRYMPECPPLQDFSPALVGADFPRGSGQSGGCESFNKAVLTEISRLGSEGLQTVVLAARWNAYVSDAAALLEAARGLEQTLQGVSASGVHVVVVAPTPDLNFEAPACLARRPKEDCAISRHEAESRRQIAYSMMTAAVLQSSSATLFDPVPELCTEVDCPAFDHGVVIYSDKHHLSVAGSLRLSQGIERALARSASFASASGVKP